MKVVPDNILRRLSPEDRAALGKAGKTFAECCAEADTRSEKELQEDMVRLLDQRSIFFSRARMDKKTTTRVGMFDFTIYLPNGRYLAVEAKVKDGRISAKQGEVFEEFRVKTGQLVKIVYNLKMFREILDQHYPPK